MRIPEIMSRILPSEAKVMPSYLLQASSLPSLPPSLPPSLTPTHPPTHLLSQHCLHWSPRLLKFKASETQLHTLQWFLRRKEGSEVTWEVEGAEEAGEAEEADAAEDSRFVAFSNKGLADSVRAALTLTICL